MPDVDSKNDPQYRSWDQTDVAAKRRKDIPLGNQNPFDCLSDCFEMPRISWADFDPESPPVI